MNKLRMIMRLFPWIELFLSITVVSLSYFIFDMIYFKASPLEYSGFMLLLIFVLVIVLIALLLSLQKDREKYYVIKLQAEQIRQIEALYGAFRAERHDLINHVQTIYGFVHANQIDLAKQYLSELSSEIKAINQVLIRDNPALSALLQVKSAQASRMGIEMDLTLQDSLKRVPLRSIELNTLVGNVLNNAFEAFQEQVEQKDKRIWLSSRILDAKTVELVVGNNGPLISQEYMPKLFQQGISGKKGHSGIGLSSVKEILDSIDAMVTVSSDLQNGTLFVFRLPAKESDGSHIELNGI